MIGIPVTSNDVNPFISDKFGRSDYFAIIEKDIILSYIPNRCKTTPTGAGELALKLLMDNGVETIIAPYIGSTTKYNIKKYNLKVFDSGNSIRVSDALTLLKSGKLIKMI